MDIASLAVGMSQCKVMEEASISVMKMAMDSGKQNAKEMTEMISDPNVGQNFDSRG
ncbi:YjfB family protein [Clostridium drakei]|uniref:Motility protein n=1 Tax=Clostridium drakei TaxID=332101 RepID=A0A2U8DNC9_9CLOT|nr:YjfB family protein [Clostridium drakei]AWI03692.1 hypothetical protein B9W14_04070 [Clostridium drakei]